MSQTLLTPKSKPRIAIMGEFSAGKSTLCNLLLGARPLPEKVTATQLPPVWMKKGPGQDVRVGMDGSETPISLDTLNDVPVADTRYVRLHFDVDVLDHCDFIDFPGISDPNMDAEVWERVLVEADAVIWLTHATQAWRQTEAAVWETVPEAVQKNSVLLITRFDKLITDLDRKRVLARLRKETDGLFNAVFPISLIEAIAGRDDYTLWEQSGAAAFMDHMADLMGTLATERAKTNADTDDADAVAAPESGTDDAPIVVRSVGPDAPVRAKEPAAPVAPKVMPRRVRPQGAGRRERPGGLGAQRLTAQ